MLQAQPDILLGWTSLGNGDYLVRQLNDHKGSIEDADLRGAGLTEYATTCGEVLARGHARSGDAAVLAGYFGAERWLGKGPAEVFFCFLGPTDEEQGGFQEGDFHKKIKAGGGDF